MISSKTFFGYEMVPRDFGKILNGLKNRINRWGCKEF